MYRKCGKAKCRYYKSCKRNGAIHQNTSEKEKFIKLLNKNREAVSKEVKINFSNVKIRK